MVYFLQDFMSQVYVIRQELSYLPVDRCAAVYYTCFVQTETRFYLTQTTARLMHVLDILISNCFYNYFLPFCTFIIMFYIAM